MLNGKLNVSRADNGFILSWYDGKDMSPRNEVYSIPNAFSGLCRIAEIIGVEAGAAAARQFLETAQAACDPSVDPDVAEMMPDHAPPSSFAGD